MSSYEPVWCLGLGPNFFTTNLNLTTAGADNQIKPQLQEHHQHAVHTLHHEGGPPCLESTEKGTLTDHACRKVLCPALIPHLTTLHFPFTYKLDLRKFTSFALLRPSLSTFTSSPGLAVPTSTTSIITATATIAPRISLHPALRSLQVRNGPRNTFDPSHRVRKRRAGFLARKRTRGGRAVLKRRMLKGRKSLSH